MMLSTLLRPENGLLWGLILVLRRCPGTGKNTPGSIPGSRLFGFCGSLIPAEVNFVGPPEKGVGGVAERVEVVHAQAWEITDQLAHGDLRL